MFTITYLKGNSIASFLFSDDIVDFKCVVVGKKRGKQTDYLISTTLSSIDANLPLPLNPKR
jgi:hypothetical protein